MDQPTILGECVDADGSIVLRVHLPKSMLTRRTWKQYKVYLFERILLCCKELNPNKPKTKLGTKTTDKKGRPKLQLKGRIFMQNVTDITKFSKNGGCMPPLTLLRS